MIRTYKTLRRLTVSCGGWLIARFLALLVGFMVGYASGTSVCPSQGAGSGYSTDGALFTKCWK